MRLSSSWSRVAIPFSLRLCLCTFFHVEEHHIWRINRALESLAAHAAFSSSGTMALVSSDWTHAPLVAHFFDVLDVVAIFRSQDLQVRRAPSRNRMKTFQVQVERSKSGQSDCRPQNLWKRKQLAVVWLCRPLAYLRPSYSGMNSFPLVWCSGTP